MEYSVKIDDNEAQLILKALGELPIKIALGAFLKVNGQILSQQKVFSTEAVNGD